MKNINANEVPNALKKIFKDQTRLGEKIRDDELTTESEPSSTNISTRPGSANQYPVHNVIITFKENTTYIPINRENEQEMEAIIQQSSNMLGFSAELLQAFETTPKTIDKETNQFIDPYQSQAIQPGDWFFHIAVDASKIENKQTCKFRDFVNAIFYVGAGRSIYHRSLYLKWLLSTIKNDQHNRFHRMYELREGTYIVTPGSDWDEKVIKCHTGPIIEAIGQNNLPYCAAPSYKGTEIENYSQTLRHKLGALQLYRYWQYFKTAELKLFTFEEIMWESIRDELKVLIDETLGQFVNRCLPHLKKENWKIFNENSEQNKSKLKDNSGQIQILEEEQTSTSQSSNLSSKSSRRQLPRKTGRIEKHETQIQKATEKLKQRVTRSSRKI
uniref:Uncharacterized protein n=1 Tax=Acrobeloides nanus TaxID=290746 RepID=A0A914CAW1_9BILA